MIVSLRDDLNNEEQNSDANLFNFIPKGFLNCQLSIVNCQLNYNLPDCRS